MSARAKLIAKVGAGAAALLLAMVPVFEGTILRTYRDPIGVLTSCVGHTGPELRMGQRWTPEQCQQQLAADLLHHAGALARKTNAGDLAGACAELSRWTYAGGRQLPGLIKRRAAEREMCES